MLRHQGSHGLVLKPLSDDVKALYQGDAGLHHGGHLTGENSDIRGLNFFTAERKQGLAFRFTVLALMPCFRSWAFASACEAATISP